jgi:hypothetical protein
LSSNSELGAAVVLQYAGGCAAMREIRAISPHREEKMQTLKRLLVGFAALVLLVALVTMAAPKSVYALGHAGASGEHRHESRGIPRCRPRDAHSVSEPERVRQ